ncbi:MAG: GNAT family N-acetyltransferase [Aestuariivirgaceae bacterium]|nr:GNAT family N-acetyltransferase [Aestuariivirgaceae bacterium]
MIETTRLTLRPFERRDAEALPPIADGMGMAGALIQGPHGLALARELIASFMARPAHSPCFAICRKDGTLMGAASYGTLRAEPVPELGYWLGSGFWRKGYGREAATAITAHAFRQVNCPGLQAECRIGNEASRRILTGLGFTPTGTRISTTERPGKATEMECFHLPRTVWLAQRHQPGQILP